jgi:integrase
MIALASPAVAVAVERKPSKKINFSVATLKALTCPPGKSRVYVYDQRTPGLAYLLTENGARSFYLYRKIDGKPVRIRLGGEEITIEQARTLAAKHNGKIAEGQNPQEEIRQRKHEMTVGKLWEWYLEHHAKPHKRSWKRDEQQWRDHLSDLSARRLSSVKRSEVQELHTRIGENVGPIAANRAIEILRTMFNVATDKLDWHKPNPCKGIERFKENERDRFLQADELPRFFAALEQEPSQLFKDYFVVLLFTGQRKSCVGAMEWPHIDMTAGVWTIPAEQSKNGKLITVPLASDVMTILKRRYEERGDSRYVFPSYGKCGHLVESKFGFKRIRERAGLKDVRQHDLRRTLGSWQAAGGSSLQIIGRSLGHISERATRVYSRLHLDPVRESVNAATAAMRAAVKAGKKKAKAKGGAK